MSNRHPAIVHWTEIEDPEASVYDHDDEPMSHGANYRRHFDFRKIGVHHERVPPGRRTSFPHAESAEEEFVYVLEGTPDVWLDGELHRLAPGDAVGFPSGTGLAHTFINNTDAEVHLLVVGERSKPDTRIVYPVNPERKPYHDDWWTEAPVRPLGPHDGQPDAVRKARAAGRKPA